MNGYSVHSEYYEADGRLGYALTDCHDNINDAQNDIAHRLNKAGYYGEIVRLTVQGIIATVDCDGHANRKYNNRNGGFTRLYVKGY